LRRTAALDKINIDRSTPAESVVNASGYAAASSGTDQKNAGFVAFDIEWTCASFASPHDAL
jgi:hypothetical protein